MYKMCTSLKLTFTFGGFHDSLQDSGVMPEMSSGPPGDPGAPIRNKNTL